MPGKAPSHPCSGRSLLLAHHGGGGIHAAGRAAAGPARAGRSGRRHAPGPRIHAAAGALRRPPCRRSRFPHPVALSICLPPTATRHESVASLPASGGKAKYPAADILIVAGTGEYASPLRRQGAAAKVCPLAVANGSDSWVQQSENFAGRTRPLTPCSVPAGWVVASQYRGAKQERGVSCVSQFVTATPL